MGAGKVSSNPKSCGKFSIIKIVRNLFYFIFGFTCFGHGTVHVRVHPRHIYFSPNQVLGERYRTRPAQMARGLCIRRGLTIEVYRFLAIFLLMTDLLDPNTIVGNLVNFFFFCNGFRFYHPGHRIFSFIHSSGGGGGHSFIIIIGHQQSHFFSPYQFFGGELSSSHKLRNSTKKCGAPSVVARVIP